jgi:hypothetical protein
MVLQYYYTKYSKAVLSGLLLAGAAGAEGGSALFLVW